LINIDFGKSICLASSVLIKNVISVSETVSLVKNPPPYLLLLTIFNFALAKALIPDKKNSESNNNRFENIEEYLLRLKELRPSLIINQNGRNEELSTVAEEEKGYRFVEYAMVLPTFSLCLVEGAVRPKSRINLLQDFFRSGVDPKVIIHIDGSLDDGGDAATVDYTLKRSHEATDFTDFYHITEIVLDHHGARTSRRDEPSAIKQASLLYSTMLNDSKLVQKLSEGVVCVINDVDLDAVGSVVVALIHTAYQLNQLGNLKGDSVERLKKYLGRENWDYMITKKVEFLLKLEIIIDAIDQTDRCLGVSYNTGELRKFQKLLFLKTEGYQRKLLDKDIKTELDVEFFYEIIKMLVSYTRDNFEIEYPGELDKIVIDTQYQELYSHEDFIYIDETSTVETGKSLTGTEHREELVNEKIARIAVTVRNKDKADKQVYYSIVVLMWKDDEFGYKKACFQAKLITAILNEIETKLGTYGHWYGSAAGGTRDKRSNIKPELLTEILGEIIPIIMNVTNHINTEKLEDIEKGFERMLSKVKVQIQDFLEPLTRKHEDYLIEENNELPKS